MTEPQPLREIASLGTVVEAGGGMVAVRVDRDLASYPEPGTRVFVGEETVSVPAERYEAADEEPEAEAREQEAALGRALLAAVVVAESLGHSTVRATLDVYDHSTRPVNVLVRDVVTGRCPREIMAAHPWAFGS